MRNAVAIFLIAVSPAWAWTNGQKYAQLSAPAAQNAPAAPSAAAPTAAAAPASATPADNREALALLDAFVRAAASGRADFEQTVTASGSARPKVSRGTFAFLRPNRFRFHTTQPFEQTIVSDGQTLWLHDPDLNQVTARPLRAALAGTPAALIASGADLSALRADYAVALDPDADGLRWVRAIPRSSDGSLQSLRLGLRMGNAGPELAVLDIADAFGGRSVLRFAGMTAHAKLVAADFAFKPPAGADVIRP